MINQYPVSTDPKIVQESTDLARRKAEAERKWQKLLEEGI